MTHPWITLGLTKGLSDIEIFSTRNKTMKLTIYQQSVDEFVQSDVESTTIRGIYKGRAATIRFENRDNANVDALLDQLIANAQAITLNEPAIIFEGSKSYPEATRVPFDFSIVPTATKIQDLKQLEQLILNHDKVSQVQSTVYYEGDFTTTLINSKGLSLQDQTTYAYAYASAVFAEGDDIQSAYDIALMHSYDEFDPKRVAQATIDLGVKKLGGKSLPSNPYPVVFSNKMFANILGVFTSIFTGESANRNLTPLKDKVGKAIAGSNIQLIDDPRHPSAFSQSRFDHEGVATFKKQLVKDGVFQGFVHNLKTASMAKTEPTGNSFGGGTSMTNFYMEPSTTSFDALIQPIQTGVYITDLVGLHAGVKTVSGEFSLQASGFKIEQGKITSPVKMIVVSGNFFECLFQIKGFASDLYFNTSNIGSPSVWIESLMIGGE
jgi:PmbA protein